MIQQTLVLLKPDAVMRGVMGRILQRFEDVGLKVVGSKMTWINEEFAEKHYFDVKERHGARILKELTAYLTEGPIQAFVLEGVESVAVVRKLVGSTYPNESLPGTIRGDFSHISKSYANKNKKKVGNLVHASANIKEAKQEIELWFTKEELHSYSVVHEAHTQ